MHYNTVRFIAVSASLILKMLTKIFYRLYIYEGQKCLLTSRFVADDVEF
jgi:hypothetical protein